jgi:phage protein D
MDLSLQQRLQQELEATKATTQTEETSTERYARQAYDSAAAHLEKVKTTKDAGGHLRYSYQDRHAAEQDFAAKTQELNKARNEGARERRIAGQEAVKAQEQAQADARDEARRAEIEASVKSQYRGAYLEAGGTAEAFEEAWPGMFKKYLREAAETRKTELEAGLRARYGGRF